MTKKTKLNIPLLKRLRTRFLRMRHPEHFDMSVIAERNECGTAMCIAGHILDLQGYTTKFDEEGNWVGHLSPGGRKVKESLRVAAKEVGLPYGEWLGSAPADAYDLFHDESIKTPRQAAARIQELIES